MQSQLVQVWQKPTTCAVFGVAYIVSTHWAFARQFAAACHLMRPYSDIENPRQMASGENSLPGFRSIPMRGQAFLPSSAAL
jgi:hypothetical protein